MNGRLDNESPGGTGSLSRSAPIGGPTGHASKPAVCPRDRWPVVGLCLLLALAVWVVFGQTRHHEFVNYDDEVYVYQNSAVTQGLNRSGIAWAFTHPHGSNWHPLTTLSHMLDCQLYGLKPGGHHLTNVLLHAATAISLFLVLRNLTGAFWRSAFVAAVFALHPLRVESVAWVSERKDVLSGLFFMLTLGAYVRYARHSGGGRQNSEVAEVAPLPLLISGLRSPSYWLALLLFTLGLMSKPMLVTVPLVLLLLDYWPLRRLELSTLNSQLSTTWRLLLEKGPFLLLAAADCVATLLAQGSAIAPVQKLSLLSRIGNALVAYAVYLGQLLYPSGLAVFYPHPGNQLSVETAGWCGGLLILVTVGVLRWQRQRPYLLVGWLWYLGMLVPVIGLVQVGIQAWADRYTYLPQIGLYVMITWGVVELCGWWRYRRVVLSSAAVMVLTGLLVLARVQTTYWRDSVSLWSHALACTSGNYLVHSNLGVALGKQGKLDEAIPHFERALQLKPDFAGAHNNLGLALGKQGKWAEALPHFERALQLQPDYADAHNNLGLALRTQGKVNEAMRHFERALQLDPDDVAAHNNLGLALAAQGKWTAARPHFQRALDLASLQGNPALVQAIRERLKSFPPASPPPQTP